MTVPETVPSTPSDKEGIFLREYYEGEDVSSLVLGNVPTNAQPAGIESALSAEEGVPKGQQARKKQYKKEEYGFKNEHALDEIAAYCTRMCAVLKPDDFVGVVEAHKKDEGKEKPRIGVANDPVRIGEIFSYARERPEYKIDNVIIILQTPRFRVDVRYTAQPKRTRVDRGIVAATGLSVAAQAVRYPNIEGPLWLSVMASVLGLWYIIESERVHRNGHKIEFKVEYADVKGERHLAHDLAGAYDNESAYQRLVQALKPT